MPESTNPEINAERLRRRLTELASELGTMYAALVKASAPPMLTRPIAEAISNILDAHEETFKVYDN